MLITLVITVIHSALGSKQVQCNISISFQVWFSLYFGQVYIVGKNASHRIEVVNDKVLFTWF